MKDFERHFERKREKFEKHFARHHRHHPHDHRGRWHWTGMTRLGWYVRAGMHRRLFMWSGISIAFTGLAVYGAMHFAGPDSGRWARIWPFLLLLFVLWGASGRLAWELARPLSELARTAGELGAGKLSSRMSIDMRHESGEVAILAAVFNNMADRIQRQIDDQRELLAGVSHELRTPLARIRLLIELMREGGGVDRLDEIEREVVEIDALVGELLASARLDFSALVRRPLDAGDAARRALERAGLSPDLLETSGNLASEADPTLLARALANLLDNARRHGGGLVKLRVSEKEDGVSFEAEDAGPGLPTEDPEALFRPFAPRTNGEPRDPGSLGLGLSLVRRIAEAHGGKAFATNRPEGGARIGFEIKRQTPSAANA